MTAAQSGQIVKLAPSDLTFLWDECRRCFWLKAKGILRRPSTPFPKVFTLLDGQTKDHFFGLPTEEMAPSLPAGRVAVGDRSVRSTPLMVPGHDARVQLGGRIDTALTFDDGSFGIIDFKTSEPKSEHAFFYARQLHAYAVAAENPAEGALRLTPVSRLGLLCVEPVAMVALLDGVAYKGRTHFLEIERDDDTFFAFLAQVLFVLEREAPPDPSPSCGFCRYLAAGSLVVLTGSYGG